MNGIKEIVFKYHPGYFIGLPQPNINIEINEDYVSYQEITTNSDKEVKGPMWKSKTDPKLFDALTKEIYKRPSGPKFIAYDIGETLITVKKEDGEINEDCIYGSFFTEGLDFLAIILLRLLKGLKIPPFLQENQEEEDDE